MRDELIMQHRRVLFDLDNIDCHRWHFSDYDSAKCVRNVQLCVAEFKMKVVPV
jgi:hypothetical protein